ncbi:zinc knuckle CX2CX4HX4C containing protein, partial [Tanacetum coccineum]
VVFGLYVLIVEKWVLSLKERGGGKGVKEKQSSFGDNSFEVSNCVNEAPGSNYADKTPNVLTSLGLNLESELLKDLDALGTGNGKFSDVGADSGIPNEGGADINGISNKESMNSDNASVGTNTWHVSSKLDNVPIDISSRPISYAKLLNSEPSRKTGYTMSTIHVKYEWTPPRCSSCKVFGHVLDECPKKIISDVLNNLKTPRKAVRGVQNGAISYGTKKQTGLDRQDVSTSNLFDALNTVEKDDEIGTNVGKSKLAEKGANSDVGEQLEESDDKIEELVDDIARYMSFTNRAAGEQMMQVYLRMKILIVMMDTRIKFMIYLRRSRLFVINLTSVFVVGLGSSAS